MAYDSVMVSTTADLAALHGVLSDVHNIDAWPGFVERDEGQDDVWRARDRSRRSFPPAGTWQVTHHWLRDDEDRPEVAFVCENPSGRSVTVSVECWSLGPKVRLVRVGTRHSASGRFMYSRRRLRRDATDFGKEIAVRAGGEVLEREGIETVQRLEIIAPADEDRLGPSGA